jgi:hypothetical protein
LQREINAAMKAAEAAYQKDLMNNVEVGGHPYSTYNTGKDVQKAVKALDPNRSATTSTVSYNTAAPASTGTEAYSQDYANYYNQYYSDPSYYYYYQQYYAQYGYYPQQQEPKTAAELKEEEKSKQREYIEQQMRKYRPESEAPKQEQSQQNLQQQQEQYAAAMAQYEAQYAQQEAPPPPPKKKADVGAPGEWQEVSAEDMYSSYYRPASPEGDDDDDDQNNNKKRPRSDSESNESDDDSDNRGKSFAHHEDSAEHDAGAEVVWKKRNIDSESRPKKKIRRTII